MFRLMMQPRMAAHQVERQYPNRASLDRALVKRIVGMRHPQMHLQFVGTIQRILSRVGATKYGAWVRNWRGVLLHVTRELVFSGKCSLRRAAIMMSAF